MDEYDMDNERDYIICVYKNVHHNWDMPDEELLQMVLKIPMMRHYVIYHPKKEELLELLKIKESFYSHMDPTTGEIKTTYHSDS